MDAFDGAFAGDEAFVRDGICTVTGTAGGVVLPDAAFVRDGAFAPPRTVWMGRRCP